VVPPPGDVPTMASGCGWPVSDRGSGITIGSSV
jgi:N-acetylglucosamine kinase-like BadF-type ATPase